MRYRKQTSTGDYAFGPGSSFHVDTPAAVGQAVATRLRLYTLEWFLDTREGLDLNHIVGSRTQAARDLEIKQRILGTPGVQSIVSYSSARDQQRNFKVTVTIDTIYGVTTLSEAF